MYLKRQTDEIDLVITDILVPELNGFQVAKHLKQIKPGLSVTAISGFVNMKFEPEQYTHLFDRISEKPYTTGRLLQTIKDLLSEK